MVKVTDPIAWWISKASSLPSISQMALDILSIPAMAADCERVFSLAKLTITSQQHSMSSDTAEQAECLKNWLRRGSITLGGYTYKKGTLVRCQ